MFSWTKSKLMNSSTNCMKNWKCWSILSKYWEPWIPAGTFHLIWLGFKSRKMIVCHDDGWKEWAWCVVGESVVYLWTSWDCSNKVFGCELKCCRTGRKTWRHIQLLFSTAAPHVSWRSHDWTSSSTAGSTDSWQKHCFKWTSWNYETSCHQTMM